MSRELIMETWIHDNSKMPFWLRFWTKKNFCATICVKILQSIGVKVNLYSNQLKCLSNQMGNLAIKFSKKIIRISHLTHVINLKEFQIKNSYYYFKKSKTPNNIWIKWKKIIQILYKQLQSRTKIKMDKECLRKTTRET